MALQRPASSVHDAISVHSDGSPESEAEVFVSRRDLLVAQSHDRPVERLASFLIFLSRENVYTGGDGRVIGNDLRCDFVAELLHLTIDEPEFSLLVLQRLGLLHPRDDGALELIDMAGLEVVSGTPPS